MLLIYASHINPRLAYIVKTLFKEHAALTNDAEYFAAFNGVRINYSLQPVVKDEYQIKPCGLLEENNIRPQHIHCFEWNNLKAFFKTSGHLPFDIFSASFYLVARYEEYLPYITDEYGRYAHTNSIAHKENFLHLPLINLWMKELEKQLAERFATYIPMPSSFTFLPTYDIDIAYSYLHKGWWRNTGGFVRDLVRFKINSLKERLAVLRQQQKDPYDVFDWLDDLHQRYAINPVYFFLLANKAKGYDRNIDPGKETMRMLIRHHTERYPVGIHPSWQSGDDPEVLTSEIKRLEIIKGEAVFQSRQHYIRMKLPETYHRLTANGITEDYSMGYGSINGFRASICTPFYWYDLMQDKETTLLIHPFCFMEANAYFEQGLSADEAFAELQHYHDIVKQTGGELSCIFHNHFLTTQPAWISWHNGYENFLARNHSV